MILGAPLFIWAAGRFGLLAAAAVLGGSQVAASFIGYIEARRSTGLVIPGSLLGRSRSFR